jgi:hypothetical protein
VRGRLRRRRTNGARGHLLLTREEAPNEVIGTLTVT